MNGMPISQKITVETARSQIRAAIAQGNIAAAIDLLRQSGSDAAAVLHDKFSASGQQRALGLISPEEWGRAQTQLCAAILELDGIKAIDQAKIFAVEDKMRLLHLLEQRQTEQALALCADFGDDYLLLQMQLNLAHNQLGKSLMESEYWEVTKSRINYILQEMLEILPGEKPAKQGWLRKIRRLFGQVFLPYRSK